MDADLETTTNSVFEQYARMAEKDEKRKSLVKKIGKGIRTAVFSAALTLSTLAGSCKSPSGPTPPPITKTYNITVSNMDIFTSNILGGDYILNGTRAASQTSIAVKSNKDDGTLRLSSIDVDNLPNYKVAYIVLADNAGSIYLTRDAGGQHSGPKYINDNISLFAKIIPSDFNTQLLAQSIRWNADPPTIGTITNYAKQNIPVGIMNAGQEPTQNDIDDLNKIINMINDAAKGIIILEYTGITSSELPNGVTYKLYDTSVGHNQTYNGYIITKSKLESRSCLPLGTMAEELTQAATGLVADLPTRGFAYLGGNIDGTLYWKNDGARAVQLANLLPPGFQLDATSNNPAVQIYAMPTILAEPNSVANPNKAPYVPVPGIRGINVPDKIKNDKSNQWIKY